MTQILRQILRPETIARVLLVLLLVAVIAPFVVYAVPETVSAEESYVVLTASMTPAIAPGDVVVVDSVAARDVAVGDIIVFEQQAGAAIPVTHRVVEVIRSDDVPPSFRTKGDANEDADLTPVTPERLVGRVVFTIPFIGHVVQFVGTPTGFVALVVIPLGLLVVSEVVDLLRSGREPATADEATPETRNAEESADASDEFVWAEWMDATPATPTEASTESSTATELVISPTDLTLTSAALGGFLAYAAYVAVGDPAALSVSVTIAVGALFALTAGVRLFALPDSGAPTASPVRSDGGQTDDLGGESR